MIELRGFESCSAAAELLREEIERLGEEGFLGFTCAGNRNAARELVRELALTWASNPTWEVPFVEHRWPIEEATISEHAAAIVVEIAQKRITDDGWGAFVGGYFGYSAGSTMQAMRFVRTLGMQPDYTT